MSMADTGMRGWPMLYGKRLLVAAAAPFWVGAAMASEPAELDWQTAIVSFAEGERRSSMVFTINDAARCSGRWMLHADAVDDGAFPAAALDAFIDQLQLQEALHAADFFRTEDRNYPAYRDAADEAERLLTLALAGNAAAARAYFDNLGLCSTQPEMVHEGPGMAIDAAAATQNRTKTSPAELPSSDFDEPVNQQRLSFVDRLMGRLRDGAPVADLLKPQISFVYQVESECAAVTAGRVDQLPAADVDIGFMFWATYSWENPDCYVPPELDSLEGFNLNATMADWGHIEAVAEDHNFEVFYVTGDRTNDYLLISIEPRDDTYAVSLIEYRSGSF